MVDPTSDLEEDVDESSAPTCSNCGDSIVNEPSHRVVSWVEDGTAKTAHFCDESCRHEWNDGKAA